MGTNPVNKNPWFLLKKIFFAITTSNFSHVSQHDAQLRVHPKTNISFYFTFFSKISTPNHFDFFLSELFFQFLFFPEHPKFYTYIFFPLSTLWKFFFGHLDFFFSLTEHLYFFYVITPTLDIFFDFKKNLANAHPRTVDKFLSNIECHWYRNFLNKPKLLKAI